MLEFVIGMVAEPILAEDIPSRTAETPYVLEPMTIEECWNSGFFAGSTEEGASRPYYVVLRTDFEATKRLARLLRSDRLVGQNWTSCPFIIADEGEDQVRWRTFFRVDFMLATALRLKYELDWSEFDSVDTENLWMLYHHFKQRNANFEIVFRWASLLYNVIQAVAVGELSSGADGNEEFYFESVAAIHTAESLARTFLEARQEEILLSGKKEEM